MGISVVGEIEVGIKVVVGVNVVGVGVGSKELGTTVVGPNDVGLRKHSAQMDLLTNPDRFIPSYRMSYQFQPTLLCEPTFSHLGVDTRSELQVGKAACSVDPHES